MTNLKELFQHTRNLNPSQAESLLGERKFGSKWGRDFTEEDFDLNWVEQPKFEDSTGMFLPQCRYFALLKKDVQLAFPNCTQRVEVLPAMNIADVQVQVSEHVDQVRKHELVSNKVTERQCEVGWCIVGPAEDKDGNPIPDGGEMIWTSFPGEMTVRLPADWDGDLTKLDQRECYAVKAL